MDVVDLLNKDDDSPLKGRVKMMPGQKNTWIKNTFLKMILQPYMGKAWGSKKPWDLRLCFPCSRML